MMRRFLAEVWDRLRGVNMDVLELEPAVPKKSMEDQYRDRWMAIAKLHLTLLDVQMPADHYLDKSELEERYP